MTALGETMRRQPDDLRRILGDAGPVEAAAARLAGRRVVVAGTGTSWHAANQGAFLLRLAGLDAHAAAAADIALHGPAPAAGDALVLLSHRGTKRFTSDVLARARDAGVRTVAIGGIGAAGADIETVAQERSGTFTASHLGALARLAQLAVALGRDVGPLDRVPDAVAAALAAPQPVALPRRGLDFVGAGPNQWTALEGALKVREAAHVYAAGYAAEQLLHGPGFALGADDTVVALDGGGPYSERLGDLLRAIEANGARVHRFEAPELGEPLSVFPLTAAVQRIAHDFSEQLGTDPDDVAPPSWKALQL